MSQREDSRELEDNALMVGKMNLTWVQEMDDVSIDLLIDQMHKGKKIGGVFTKNAYAIAAHVISEKFGIICHSDHVKNKMKTLKDNFSAAKDILNSSGSGFNSSTQIIEAPSSVWETYIKAHPGASKLRYKPARNYEKMDQLIVIDQAT